MFMYAIWLITSAIVGCMAAAFALKHGKNPWLWFAIGAVLNVFVLIVISTVKERKTAQAKRA